MTWQRIPPAPMLLAVVAAISPFDLGRPEDGWTGLHLRPLLLVTATLALAALILGHRPGPWPRPGARAGAGAGTRAGAGAAALVAGFLVASLVSTDPTIGLAVTMRVAVLCLVFLAASGAMVDQGARRVLVAGVAVGVALASVIGLAVVVVGHDGWGTGWWLGSISKTNGVTRLTRPFSHANVAAMYLAPAVVLVAAGVGWAQRRSVKVMLLAVAVLGAGALSLTLSRAGVGALVVATVGWMLFDRRARSAGRSAVSSAPVSSAAGLTLVVSAAIGVGLISGRWSSRLDPSTLSTGARAPDRLTIWDQAIDAFAGSPLVGVGPGRFGLHARSLTPAGEAAATHAHSPVLEAMATGGLVATAGVVVFGLTVLVPPLRALPLIPVGLSAAMAAATLPMIVDNPFLFSSSGNLAALVAGTWCSGAARGAVEAAGGQP